MKESLDELLDERSDVLRSAAAEAGISADGLRRVLATSDFAWDLLRREPELLALVERAEPVAYEGPEPGADADALMAALRRMRKRECLRLLLRDVLEHDPLVATLAGCTALAERCIDIALRQAGAELELRHGLPHDEAGRPLGLVVLGLGKLGGGELNFSSDIDLIFAYAGPGRSDGLRPLEAEDWFTRAGKRLIHLLGAHTGDGFCHRVDMRLRPFGSAGRLVLSFAAMEQYYQRDGRDWERYAWVKARPVGGDREAGEQLLRLLRPFVYRRYLDYANFEAFREMKARIDAEVTRRGLGAHLKLGPGGIREIEFIVQLEQLIRGGREPALRESGLHPALAALERIGRISASQADMLREVYALLRRVENRLQMLRDEQVHELPEDEIGRQRLALSLGLPDWPALGLLLDRQRARVSAMFASVFTGPGERGEASPQPATLALWQAAQDGTGDEDDALVAQAREAGFADPSRAAAALRGLLDSPAVRALSARSRARFERVLPALLAACPGRANAETTLERLLRVAAVIARRSNYLALLDEHPGALARLVDCCERSAWLAHTLAEAPLLIDDLLDPRLLEPEPLTERVRGELERRRDSGGDIAWDMEILRQVQQSTRFRLALQRVENRIDPVSIARSLARLAELLLAEVLRLAERELARSAGWPAGRDGRSGLAILGYGSLGGRELNIASDLDLVFLYPSDCSEGSSSGPRSLPNPQYYVRLAQRVVALLTTRTSTGPLYEVDTRLRPNGNAGLLVSTFDAYARYQREDAWTWEHQALLRARVMVAEPELAEGFEALRREILGRRREAGPLRADVLDIRERLRQAQDRSRGEAFDLKQGRGGLVDLEFLLQALVLRHAHQHPALIEARDTPNLIRACARAGVISSEHADGLGEAHGQLLAAAQACTLDQRPRLAVRRNALNGSIDLIQTAWERLLKAEAPLAACRT